MGSFRVRVWVPGYCSSNCWQAPRKSIASCLPNNNKDWITKVYLSRIKHHIRVYHQPNSCTNKAKIFHPHLHEQFDHPPAQPAINKFDTGFSDVYVRTVRTLYAHHPLSASHRLCNINLPVSSRQQTMSTFCEIARPFSTTETPTPTKEQHGQPPSLVIYLVPKRTSCTLYCTLIQPTKPRHCNIHHQSHSSFTASPQILTTPHLTHSDGKSKKTGR